MSRILASSNNDIRLKIKSFEQAQISHCNLIGECFVEEWMFGEKFTQLIERDSYAGKSCKRPAAAKYDDWKRGQGKVSVCKSSLFINKSSSQILRFPRAGDLIDNVDRNRLIVLEV